MNPRPSVFGRRSPPREVRVGGVRIGGGAPVAVQTMTTTPPDDPDAALAQIRAVARAGADLVRCAVPTVACLDDFRRIAAESPLPVIADVHFDWRIAVGALRAGAAKVRVNPGNMPAEGGRLEELARMAAELGRAVRIGVNSGSARAATGAGVPARKGASVAEEADADAARRMADEALEYVERFERAGLGNLVVSLKTPSARSTVLANRELAGRCDLPIHLGVTHAGLEADALLKSAVALGGLLLDGIGDTLRLSYTGDPEREVAGALDLLRAAGLRRDRAELIACPTCGRCRVRLVDWAEAVRRRLDEIPPSLTVAVMGCEVNGPGEAAAADVGLAASGSGRATLFAGGRPIGTVAPEAAVDELIRLAARMDMPDNFH